MDQDDEDIIPAGPLAIDAAAVVSETDAAHSSGDEGGGWLSRRHHRTRCNGNNTSHGDEDDSDDDTDTNMKDAAGPEDLYGKHMDDDDEAWVYKNMRSGREALASVRQQHQEQDHTTNNDERADDDESSERPSKSRRGPPKDYEELDGYESVDHDVSKSTHGSHKPTKDKSNSRYSEGEDPEKYINTKQTNCTAHESHLKQALLLKPRTSDAILSCPRCFNIVCMDCQQHERYANQYRAMFVMNIGVDWNKRMIYDEAVGGLKLNANAGSARERGETDAMVQFDNAADATAPDTIPHDTSDHDPPNNQEKDELYYSVHCSYCQWEVAALDMKDEIYYFFGCIASA
mmetsp:Transcript_17830/g.42921  ORF Transcript_17830/g.42921 Transcript_17830/m.42921 type:complete len:345 (+) Transcript_17830:33-1067(+)